MHVAHAQVCALHKHREVDLTPAAQVLDVAVAAILPTRYGPGSLARDTVPLGTLFDLEQDIEAIGKASV